jgi:predicted nucleic acid-binding protein
MVVDTTVWADYFNGVENPHTDRLDLALAEEEDVAILSLVITEVLQGFRTEAGFLRARDLLLRLPVLVPSLECHVEAARLFRRLRAKGITIRGTIDCIIAHTCIEFGAELLSPDADFRRIADHTKLNLWRR